MKDRNGTKAWSETRSLRPEFEPKRAPLYQSLHQRRSGPSQRCPAPTEPGRDSGPHKAGASWSASTTAPTTAQSPPKAAPFHRKLNPKLRASKWTALGFWDLKIGFWWSLGELEMNREAKGDSKSELRSNQWLQWEDDDEIETLTRKKTI